MCEELSRSLDLHMFNHEHRRPSPVRRTFTLAEMTSARARPGRGGGRSSATGHACARSSCRATSASSRPNRSNAAVLDAQAELVVLDLRRVRDIHRAAVGLLAGLGDRVGALSAAPHALREA